MTNEEAINYIHEHSSDYFERDKSGKGWICPICGSGSGRKGTGITSKDGGRHYTCWAGCFKNADVIDIIGQVQNIPEGDSHFPERLKAAADEFHITLDDRAAHQAGTNRNKQVTVTPERKATGFTAKTDKARVTVTPQDEPTGLTSKTDKAQVVIEQEDLMNFFLEANGHIAETDYHRGLSLETLKHFLIGFMPQWRHPKAPDRAPFKPVLIIPTSRYSYVARDTRDNIPAGEETYKKQKFGSQNGAIFGYKDYLNAAEPVFIAEGELDAASFYEAGAVGITAGSAAQWETVAKFIIQNRPKSAVIIAFDSDDTGKKRGDDLAAELIKAGISFTCYTPPNGAKDANEALMTERDTFIASVNEAIEQAKHLPLQASPELSEPLEGISEQDEEVEREEYLRTAAAHNLEDFIANIEKSKEADYFPTGFANLDKILDGGIYAGLYILGAISSLGKTSLSLQIADNIASSGHDVLIFSLEMARNELIAKSISRNTFLIARERKQSRLAKTTRGILTGVRYDKYSEAELEVIEAALKCYGNYARQIFIHEGVGNIGAEQVRTTVEKHIRLTGNRPLVLIDYAQILAPYAERLTDKQSIDKSVLELKRLSRDYDIPVLAISSFNRESYNQPVSMAAFKESGAVEYSSDVLIGLQYDGFDFRENERDGDRLKRIRELYTQQQKIAREGMELRIQAKILKNRNGNRGDAFLKYWPMFNYFEAECDDNNDNWEVVGQQGQQSLF